MSEDAKIDIFVAVALVLIFRMNTFHNENLYFDFFSNNLEDFASSSVSMVEG
jgi:hypothetical protein